MSATDKAQYADLVEFYFGGETFAQFLARVAPHEPPPPHLQIIVDLFQRCRTERVRACVSMPPRAGKSITIKRGLAWWLSRSPEDLCCYASYNSEFADEQAGHVRDIAIQAGVKMEKDKAASSNWRVKGGGGVFAAGLNSGITGRGVNGCFLVDDPFKNPLEARSPVVRATVSRNFNQVVRTRLEGDASCIVVQTRWHEDDLVGDLIKEGGWEIINIPALAMAGDPLGRKEGDPLWPERSQFTLEALSDLRRVDQYAFEALYQGRPISEGTRMFYGEPRFYDPKSVNLLGCKYGIGCDPATTKKTSADFSAAFAIAVMPPWHVPVVYLIDGFRDQVTTPELCRRLNAFQRKNHNARMCVEAVGGFKAVPQILHEIDPHLLLTEIQPLGDKRQRAELLASAWNDGRILLPLTDPHLPGSTAQPPWVKDLVYELKNFTGEEGRTDDQVDALSHVYNTVAVAKRSIFGVL